MSSMLERFCYILRGEFQIKNVTKSGKSPKGGKGSAPKIKKEKKSNFGLFDKRGVMRENMLTINMTIDLGHMVYVTQYHSQPLLGLLNSLENRLL